MTMMQQYATIIDEDRRLVGLSRANCSDDSNMILSEQDYMTMPPVKENNMSMSSSGHSFEFEPPYPPSKQIEEDLREYGKVDHGMNL